ncbi:MAG: DNA recombination protein RmuC [Rickettsiales bacterium]|jgi:DNA recombination protein RmuC|nr:DNA recombination protein RmuC [Rickettsiales bacterium]
MTEIIIAGIVCFVIGVLIGRLYSQHRYEVVLQQKATLEAENRAVHSKMFDQFKLISAELLEHQKKSVAETQQEKLCVVLDPLQKQIKDVLEKTAENKISFAEQMKTMIAQSGALQKEAADLANALKHKKQQGNWGEFQLERIFEILGFVEGREYSKEVFARGEDGSGVRPDYVLNLPNNRRVVIDSKLSLESYMKYANSEDESEKKKYIREFVAATKKHIDTLGDKEYQNKLKDSQLDYVFMFMPLEHSYLAALEEDPELYQYSFKNNVALATPSLLFPMMRTIDTMLKIDKRDKNIEIVVDMVNKLYEKYVGFTENFADVGKRLDGAQKAYDEALGQLSAGKGNISGWFEKIRDKSGIASNKKIAVEYEE